MVFFFSRRRRNTTSLRDWSFRRVLFRSLLLACADGTPLEELRTRFIDPTLHESRVYEQEDALLTDKIGRAACRERGESFVGAAAVGGEWSTRVLRRRTGGRSGAGWAWGA